MISVRNRRGLECPEAIRIGRNPPKLAFGVLGLFFTHIFENIGMTVNLMPITGIPLPFFSYGGSFMVTASVAMALCLRVAYETQVSGYSVSQEFPIRRR